MTRLPWESSIACLSGHPLVFAVDQSWKSGWRTLATQCTGSCIPAPSWDVYKPDKPLLGRIKCKITDEDIPGIGPIIWDFSHGADLMKNTDKTENNCSDTPDCRRGLC